MWAGMLNKISENNSVKIILSEIYLRKILYEKIFE